MESNNVNEKITDSSDEQTKEKLLSLIKEEVTMSGTWIELLTVLSS